jgi:hypothetical protein
MGAPAMVTQIMIFYLEDVSFSDRFTDVILSYRGTIRTYEVTEEVLYTVIKWWLMLT